MDSNTIMQINSLSKKYHDRVILENVNFTINKGDCVGIVGANGCGKSTLLRILAGADTNVSGSLSYFGDNPLKKRSLFSKHIGYIPQDNPLFENLTVLDNLKMWYCETNKDVRSELKENGSLAFFGLEQYLKYPVSKLSGGMKKRLSIACSIAKNPPVLILDEPGASLDLVCKADICEYLNTYIKNGGTVLITSHEDCELNLCTRMLFIKDSSVTEIPPKTPEELREMIR